MDLKEIFQQYNGLNTTAAATLAAAEWTGPHNGKLTVGHGKQEIDIRTCHTVSSVYVWMESLDSSGCGQQGIDMAGVELTTTGFRMTLDVASSQCQCHYLYH